MDVNFPWNAVCKYQAIVQECGNHTGEFIRGPYVISFEDRDQFALSFIQRTVVCVR